MQNLSGNILKIENLREYHDLYMETDVHLLADIFENFRNMCLDIYGMDPTIYYTSPGLAWQADLKKTVVRLDLLTDPDMHLFIEKSLRGGMAVITKRYAKANHKDVQNYDAEKPSNHLIYFDANNLYEWAMGKYLPTNDFQWLDIRHLDVDAVPDCGEMGYFFEVEYRNELHDLQRLSISLGTLRHPARHVVSLSKSVARKAPFESEPLRQEEIRAPLPKPETVSVIRDASNTSISCDVLQAKSLVETLHRF